MSRFVQPLESRVLFSAASAAAAAAVLLGDVKQVTASAGTARADLRSAQSAATAGLNKVAVDLKTSTTSANRSSNAALLKTLKTDALKTLATLRGDDTALLALGTSLSVRAAGDAKALLLHSSNGKIEARVEADIAALTTVPAARLAALQTAAQSNALGADLTNLVNANPANSALATDATAFQTGGTAAAAIGNVLTAAGTFATTIGTLNTDVTSTTTLSTIPNLVGTYTGQVTDGSHNQGLPSNWTLDITSEGTDGSFSGTITTTQNGNTSSQMQSISGSVKADGSFTATASDPTTHQVGGSLTGTASGTTLSGTFDDGMGGTGPFTLTKQ